jgi:hypothetical protein
MLTNGVLQAGLSFDKAMLNCQSMSKKLADYTIGNKWQQVAVSEEYKDIVATSGGDFQRPETAKSNRRGRRDVGRWAEKEVRGSPQFNPLRIWPKLVIT